MRRNVRYVFVRIELGERMEMLPAAMARYRAYVLDFDGHIVRRHDFEAADDAVAGGEAQQYAERTNVELWQYERMIGVLKAREPTSGQGGPNG